MIVKFSRNGGGAIRAIFFDKIVRDLDLGAVAQKMLMPKERDLIPMFVAAFNPAFHLIKFSDDKPALTMYALVKLPKPSSYTNDARMDLVDLIYSAAGLLNIMTLANKGAKGKRRSVKKRVRRRVSRSSS